MDQGSTVQRMPAVQRYGGAVLLTLLVIAGRYALNPWWGHQHNRHLVFLPTVMVAAWVGGFRAGLLSTAMTTVALDYFWSDSPASRWHAPSVDLVLFVLLSVVLCAIIASLQDARANADAATRSRQRVLEIVAHDLRSPLTAVLTTAEAIGTLAPEMQPRVARIERAVTRMDNLIRDLMDATRIEHGELKVSLAPEPIDAVVQEAVELFATAAQEHGIALESRRLADPALRVMCDRERIVQVLSNLIGNALKFTPEGGRITVSVDRKGDEVELAVADTGRGIPPENLERVFEKYWRSDEKGTGLGLFIARSIVRAQGGRISVASTVGAGATFTFTIPVTR